MRSVADDLRARTGAELAALTPAERITLALRLGERDLSLFAAAQHLDLEQARRILRQRRQLGRQPSSCMNALHAEPL